MDEGAANIAIVERLFESWQHGFDAMIDGFHAHLAPDCFLQQTRSPDLRGIDEIVSFMNNVRAAGVVETILVENRNLIAQGHFVVSERIDYLRDASGATIATVPAIGIMEMKDGKVAVWRDYFDSADMQPEAMAAIAVS